MQIALTLIIGCFFYLGFELLTADNTYKKLMIQSDKQHEKYCKEHNIHYDANFKPYKDY